MKTDAQNIGNSREGTPQNPLAQTLNVAGLTISNRFFLAPMSGITDVPFRKRAHEAGAGLVVSEMVASQEYVTGSAESMKRSLATGSGVHMVQLAGREAHWMGEAAKRVEASGADIIDINMGCPAKKVTGGYSGSALMRDLDHAMTLIEATIAAVKIPVTLKMRLGWDERLINAPELAKRAENAGVQMITVHGRTRCQFYTGRADWDAIAAVKSVVSVPLVVNGDISSLSDAQTALAKSGAGAVMIGRAHYGQPWAAGALAKSMGLHHINSTPDDLFSYVVSHYEDMLSAYGTEVGIRHARKHLGWYLDRHAPETDASVKASVMTGLIPAKVIEALKVALANCNDLTKPESIAA
ncbi:MAG: tRNA dihydrouridine synthase DusB [Rhizobiaceae bacterium]